MDGDDTYEGEQVNDKLAVLERNIMSASDNYDLFSEEDMELLAEYEYKQTLKDADDIVHTLDDTYGEESDIY